MTFEAAFGVRPGELRIADVRASLGSHFATARSVEVVVVGAGGAPAFAGLVPLGRKPSGRGEHVALVCPRCNAACNVLRTDPRGQLRCGACTPRRTRQQLRKNNPAWRRGDREEDLLLRIVEMGRARLPAGLELAERLAREIVDGDRDRFAVLMPRVRAALTPLDEET